MKTVMILAFAAALGISTVACSQRHTSTSGSSFFSTTEVKGSNKYVTHQIKVNDFSGINVCGAFDVTYTQQAGAPKVEVYTSDNLVELLDIYVKNGHLYIGFKENVRVSYDKLEVRVSSPKLNNIKLSGSGQFRLANGLKSDACAISVVGSGKVQGDDLSCSGMLKGSVSGSGSIVCGRVDCRSLSTSVVGSGGIRLKELEASDLKSTISGSGSTSFTGVADRAEYSITGSGNIEVSDCQVKDVSASVSGSGKIKCHATDNLKTRITGSGSIGYKGNPNMSTKGQLYRL